MLSQSGDQPQAKLVSEEQSTQLSLTLVPREPFSHYYLVPHSGIASAIVALDQLTQLEAVGKLVAEPRLVIVYIYGPEGSGKTHLAEAYAARVLDQGVSPERVQSVDFDLIDTSEQNVRGLNSDRDSHPDNMAEVSSAEVRNAGQFVALYERLKREGGFLFVTGRRDPQSATENPHVRSRLLAGEVLQLKYPQESELLPILHSISERKNLRLSEYSLAYLLKRIPADPLSFDNIFCKIDQLSSRLGKPANQSVVREVVAD